jgi:CHAT domain-containing protein
MVSLVGSEETTYVANSAKSATAFTIPISMPRLNFYRRLSYALVAIAIAVAQIFGSAVATAITPPAALIQQGTASYEQGDFATAYSLWQRAEAAYQQTNNVSGVVGSKINQSQALVGLGMYRRACKALASIVQVSESVCTQSLPTSFGIRQGNLSDALQTLALNSLGDVLRRLGNLEAAQITLAEAGAVAKELPIKNRSPIYITLANTLRDLGNRDRDRTDLLTSPGKAFSSCQLQFPGDLSAASYYQRAIACYQQANDLIAQIDELSLSANIQQWLEQREQPLLARQWQQRFNITATSQGIQSSIANQPDTYAGLRQRIHFARSWAILEPEQDTQALALLNRVVDRAGAMPGIAASAMGTIGEIYERKKQWPAALQSTQQAIAWTQASPNSDSLYQWEWQLGRILQHQDRANLKQAKAAYERAVLSLEKTRSNIQAVNTDAQFSLRDAVSPLYRELMDVSLRLPQPNLAQVVGQLDALKLAELENFLACSLDNYQSVDLLAEDDRATVFYPVIFKNRLEIIVKLERNRWQRLTVNVSRAQLEATIAQFRSNLLQPQYGWDESPAAQLYDWLIRPVHPYLSTATQRLVFVMDGLFQDLPVAALYDRRHQKYLVDSYPVAVTPGLKILGAKRSRSVRSATGRLPILIGGLTGQQPQRLTARRGGSFGPLTFAAQEVQGIQSKFGRARVLVGRDFTEAKLRQVLAADAYGTIHLATHGQFSSDPRQTFVVTDGGGSIDLEGLRSLLRSGGGEPLDLMVLSACETAAGDRRAALGLAGMATRSGAASTLASLWSVDDGATAELMQAFYGALVQEGATKAGALRSAQLAVRQEHEHPYYWAAFVLVGNWL